MKKEKWTNIYPSLLFLIAYKYPHSSFVPTPSHFYFLLVAFLLQPLFLTSSIKSIEKMTNIVRVSLMVMIICIGLYNTHGIDARKLVAIPAMIDKQSQARLLIESLMKLHSDQEGVKVDISITRTVPGGPDPQHHETPPKPMSQSPPVPAH